MNNFENIQAIWDTQDVNTSSDVPQELYDRIKKSNSIVNNKHIWTIIILSVTVIVMGGGFGYILNSLVAKLGLLIMELALILRIIIECYSYRKKKRLDVTEYTNLFQQRLIKFYEWRRKLHLSRTMYIVIAYVIGVGMMFLEFRHSLSSFWFNFFAIEFVVIAIVLIWFIRRHINKEIKDLTELIESCNLN